MAIMLGKMYAALKAAGAPDEEARAAAEEVGGLLDQFGGLRDAMHELRGDFRGEMAGIRSEVAYPRGRFDALIWAVGINAAATIAILGVLLRH